MVVKSSKLYADSSTCKFYSFLSGECKTRDALLQVSFYSLSDPITLRVELQSIKVDFKRKEKNSTDVISSRKPVHFLQEKKKQRIELQFILYIKLESNSPKQNELNVDNGAQRGQNSPTEPPHG